VRKDLGGQRPRDRCAPGSVPPRTWPGAGSRRGQRGAADRRTPGPPRSAGAPAGVPRRTRRPPGAPTPRARSPPTRGSASRYSSRRPELGEGRTRAAAPGPRPPGGEVPAHRARPAAPTTRGPFGREARSRTRGAGGEHLVEEVVHRGGGSEPDLVLLVSAEDVADELPDPRRRGDGQLDPSPVRASSSCTMTGFSGRIHHHAERLAGAGDGKGQVRQRPLRSDEFRRVRVDGLGVGKDVGEVELGRQAELQLPLRDDSQRHQGLPEVPAMGALVGQRGSWSSTETRPTAGAPAPGSFDQACVRGLTVMRNGRGNRGSGLSKSPRGTGRSISRAPDPDEGRRLTGGPRRCAPWRRPRVPRPGRGTRPAAHPRRTGRSGPLPSTRGGRAPARASRKARPGGHPSPSKWTE
jgi:hypothetical protein